MYRNIECREPIKLPPTVENIRYAGNLVEEIRLRIARNNFNYADYFPESKRARLFGHVVSDKTVEQLLDDFLREKSRNVEKSTITGYEKAVNVTKARLGHLRITDLRAQHIREWISDQTASAKRIRNLLTPLRWVCERALTDDLVKSNPMSKVIVTQLVTKAQATSKFEPDPFDIDEMRSILNACRPGHERNFWQLAFWSGLRTSELIALNWEHVDLNHNFLLIDSALVSGETKGTKTKAGTRKVQLLPLARQALVAQKPLTYIEHEHVFLNPRTNRPWTGDQQPRRTSWDYICKRAGVRRRNPYQTRHTFASIMLSNGERELWVAQQLGHVDVSTVRRHYGRWIEKASDAGEYQTVGNYDYDLEMKGNESD